MFSAGVSGFAEWLVNLSLCLCTSFRNCMCLYVGLESFTGKTSCCFAGCALLMLDLGFWLWDFRYVVRDLIHSFFLIGFEVHFVATSYSRHGMLSCCDVGCLVSSLLFSILKSRSGMSFVGSYFGIQNHRDYNCGVACQTLGFVATLRVIFIHVCS